MCKAAYTIDSKRCFTLPYILVVDDEESVVSAIRGTLALDSHIVTVARSPGQALSVMRSAINQRANIDLAIVDVGLARASGPELAAWLATMQPGLRILFISGYSSSAFVQNQIIRREHAFLEKPFRPMDLRQKVSEMLAIPASSAGSSA